MGKLVSGSKQVHCAFPQNYGVRFAWLVDPKTRTLEAYELANAKWRVLSVFRDDDTVSVAPFDAIVIRLADLWG